MSNYITIVVQVRDGVEPSDLAGRISIKEVEHRVVAMKKGDAINKLSLLDEAKGLGLYQMAEVLYHVLDSDTDNVSVLRDLDDDND